MEITIDGYKSNMVLCLDPKNPKQNGIYKIEDIFSSAKKIKEKKMKVIIELNENVSLESAEDDNLINIKFNNTFPEARSISRLININDLNVALRKMTAK